MIKKVFRKVSVHVKNIVGNNSLKFLFRDFLGVVNRRVSSDVLNRVVNERLMMEVLRKYESRTDNVESISSVFGEDYELEWGKVDYKGKIVLDVGADIGSTASFFLSKGARKVVAVEGSSVCFSRLKENVKVLGDVIPIFMFIEGASQFEDLILKCNVDVVKIDIEGSEVHLFKVKDEVFKKIKEYIIEIHSEDLLNMMLEKCKRNNYEIKNINLWKPQLWIVYARRRVID